MGDRANVAIQDGDGRVYFYTHWSGTELPELMRVGLAKANAVDRLDDPPYLARILFDTLTGRKDDVTGTGISHCVQDNNDSRPLLIIDAGKQEVTAGAEGLCKLRGDPAVFSFSDYIALKEATWELLDPARAETAP
jgi:hypothetical protein